MIELYNTILVIPLLNLLLWLYDVIPGTDIGIAIVLLTVLVRLLLYPFAKKQIKQQRAMTELQPKVDAIREKYKDNKEEQSKQLLALYQAEKVNPAASCLPLLIQLPIFIALFHVLRDVMSGTGFERLYSFVPQPGTIDPTLFGFIDLANPNYVLAILAGVVQFFSSKQLLAKGTASKPPKEVEGKPGAKDEGMAAMMNKQMIYIMPIMTIVIGFSLPGGLALYWLTMSTLMWFQQTKLLKEKTAPVPTTHTPDAGSGSA